MRVSRNTQGRAAVVHKPTKNKGIYNIITNKEWLCYSPQMSMRGWHRFCSGAVVAGISSNGRPASRGRLVKRQYLDRQLLNYDGTFDGYTTIKEYVDNKKKNSAGQSHFDIPIEYIYAWVLECLYYKHMEGIGGKDMWGHNKYHAKTFVLADVAIRGKGIVCVANFCKWLESKRPLVNITRHGPVEGAHGGKCTSWLVDINPTLTKEYLNEMVHNLNAHMKYLEEYRDNLCKAGLVAEHITENEQITQLWAEVIPDG